MIKILARDAETGRIGTFLTPFTIPNLNREEQRMPISSVVLSSQRVPLGDALYSVQQKVGADQREPARHDGQKLIPSVTRVFSRGRDLHVFLQAYQRAATTTQPLVAFVTLLSGRHQGVREPAAGGRPTASIARTKAGPSALHAAARRAWCPGGTTARSACSIRTAARRPSGGRRSRWFPNAAVRTFELRRERRTAYFAALVPCKRSSPAFRCACSRYCPLPRQSNDRNSPSFVIWNGAA